MDFGAARRGLLRLRHGIGHDEAKGGDNKSSDKAHGQSHDQ